MLQLLKKKKKKEMTIHSILHRLHYNQDLGNILDSYDLRIKDIVKIYELLKVCGADTWVKGKYVASQSLITPDTLEFIANHYKNGRFHFEGKDYNNSVYFVTDNLINYFKAR